MTDRRAEEPAHGLSRRSLLGAAVTAVVAGSTAARMLQQAGVEALGEGGSLDLVVAQHALRTDHLALAELAAVLGRPGAAGTIEPFVSLTLSLPKGSSVVEHGALHHRTRGADGWSPWTPVAFVADEGADGDEAAAGSDRVVSCPFWVGFADGLDLDVPPGLAPGLQVHLVRETPEVVALHDGTLPAFTSRAPRPGILGRSAWGARPPKATPSTASRLHMAIVHHTVTRNGYGTGEVPGMLAAIQRSHMDVNGWNDIAYNFAVDRFGRIWEARAGGIDRIVTGGHTAGFNTGNTGVAVLGNLHPPEGGGHPSGSTVDALVDLIAWKLGIHDADIATTTTYTAGSGSKSQAHPSGSTSRHRRVVGHGDLGSTACPGSAMRPQLAAIRQRAYVRQGGFPDVAVDSFYAASVSWAVHRGITDGVGTSGLFKPDDPVDRAQMAAFLWRMMGRPGGNPPHRFPDVPPGVYYDEAVRWLKAEDITDGVGTSGRYEPAMVVSRGQMAAFLWRLAGRVSGNPPHGFPDVRRGAFYDEPVRWLKAHGITDGYGTTGRFEPDIRVTRAQMAVFLQRLDRRPEAWATPEPSVPPGCDPNLVQTLLGQTC